MKDEEIQRIREECDTCMLVGKCPEKCFNFHPGSIRALMKSFNNIDVISETGDRYSRVEGGEEYVKIKRVRCKELKGGQK